MIQSNDPNPKKQLRFFHFLRFFIYFIFIILFWGVGVENYDCQKRIIISQVKWTNCLHIKLDSKIQDLSNFNIYVFNLWKFHSFVTIFSEWGDEIFHILFFCLWIIVPSRMNAIDKHVCNDFNFQFLVLNIFLIEHCTTLIVFAKSYMELNWSSNHQDKYTKGATKR